MFKLSMPGGFFDKTVDWVNRMMSPDPFQEALDRGGAAGVAALSGATPVDTGLASRSWAYRITSNGGGVTVEWYNTDIEGGATVVLLIQYGHGTGTGGYVQGKDFINPAIQPVFDTIEADIMKEVQR